LYAIVLGDQAKRVTKLRAQPRPGRIARDRPQIFLFLSFAPQDFDRTSTAFAQAAAAGAGFGRA